MIHVSNRLNLSIYIYIYCVLIIGGSEIVICDKLLTNDQVVGLAQEMANLPEL